MITSNADEVAAALVARGASATLRLLPLVRMYGALQTTAIQRHASLPRTAPRGPNTGGPRLITGDYVRSWSTEITVRGHDITATSGTNKVQGMRLEMGFGDLAAGGATGPDALGRHIDQPPYEHAGPGHDEVAPLFLAALEAIL